MHTNSDNNVIHPRRSHCYQVHCFCNNYDTEIDPTGQAQGPFYQLVSFLQVVYGIKIDEEHLKALFEFINIFTGHIRFYLAFCNSFLRCCGHPSQFLCRSGCIRCQDLLRRDTWRRGILKYIVYLTIAVFYFALSMVSSSIFDAIKTSDTSVQIQVI